MGSPITLTNLARSRRRKGPVIVRAPPWRARKPRTGPGSRGSHQIWQPLEGQGWGWIGWVVGWATTSCILF